MTDKATPIETLFERVENYGKTTIELYTLKVIDKSAEVVSALISRLVIFMAVALSVVILNMGLAIWIGQLLSNYCFGFLIIGAADAAVALVLYWFRNSLIKSPISNSIIKQMMTQKIV